MDVPRPRVRTWMSARAVRHLPPRRCGPSGAGRPRSPAERWIPAFAGMTRLTAVFRRITEIPDPGDLKIQPPRPTPCSMSQDLLDRIDQRTRLAGHNRLALLLFRLGSRQLFGVN